MFEFLGFLKAYLGHLKIFTNNLAKASLSVQNKLLHTSSFFGMVCTLNHVWPQAGYNLIRHVMLQKENSRIFLANFDVYILEIFHFSESKER